MGCRDELLGKVNEILKLLVNMEVEAICGEYFRSMGWWKILRLQVEVIDLI